METYGSPKKARLPHTCETRPGRDRANGEPRRQLTPEGVTARAVIRDIEAAISRLDEAYETAKRTSRPAPALSHLGTAREHLQAAEAVISERNRAALSPNRAIGA